MKKKAIIIFIIIIIFFCLYNLITKFCIDIDFNKDTKIWLPIIYYRKVLEDNLCGEFNPKGELMESYKISSLSSQFMVDQFIKVGALKFNKKQIMNFLGEKLFKDKTLFDKNININNINNGYALYIDRQPILNGDDYYEYKDLDKPMQQRREANYRIVIFDIDKKIIYVYIYNKSIWELFSK